MGLANYDSLVSTLFKVMTIETDAEDKMKAVVEYPFSRTRRKQFEQPLNQIEKFVFASTKSSFGRIVTAASPFCSFYASYLQQKAPDLKVSHLVEQINIVWKLKKIGTSVAYTRTLHKKEYELHRSCFFFFFFFDASRTDECGQLEVATGLLVGDKKKKEFCDTHDTT